MHFSLSYPRANKRGFTLVELLTVIAIMAVLATILIPTIGSAMDKVKKTKCANNLRQIYAAAMAYSADNQQFLPVGHGNALPGCSNLHNWNEALFYYAYTDLIKPKSGQTVDQALTYAMKNMHRGDSIFVCPCDEDPLQLGSTLGNDYNCFSYMGSVDVVFSTYTDYVANPTYPQYKRRTDDPRLRGSMMMYADAGRLSGQRPARYTNTWTPNRHGGTAPPTNNGNENLQGENNILFFDGHVEALRRDQIPADSSSTESKQFWAPPWYND